MPPATNSATRLLSARLAAGDRGAVLTLEVALRANQGAVRPAARALGVHPATLYRWMAMLGLEGRGTPGRVPKKDTDTP
jgi:transcriptional regulator of acetoin/glycerol metabolism